MMVARPLQDESEIKVYYTVELDLWRAGDVPLKVALGIERLKTLAEIEYAREGKNHRLQIL